MARLDYLHRCPPSLLPLSFPSGLCPVCWRRTASSSFFLRLFPESELVFRDSSEGLSILDVSTMAQRQIVDNTTFVRSNPPPRVCFSFFTSGEARWSYRAFVTFSFFFQSSRLHPRIPAFRLRLLVYLKYQQWPQNGETEAAESESGLCFGRRGRRGRQGHRGRGLEN